MTETEWGIVACDDAFPFGTQFIVEDMDTIFVCEDRGSGVIGNWLDLWFPSCWLARQFGIRKRWVEVRQPVMYLVRPSWRRQYALHEELMR